jgi:hypothetical protein
MDLLKAQSKHKPKTGKTHLEWTTKEYSANPINTKAYNKENHVIDFSIKH